MWEDWLIAGPILGYCAWVIIRQLSGKGKGSCGCSHHSVYGIPDEAIPGGCEGCPLKAKCRKRNE